MSDKNELPHRSYTTCGYVVTGPDLYGQIEVREEQHCYFIFTEDDLRMMLDRIERGKK